MTITSVDICNRALQMAAARATITSLSDGTNEANNCNLLYGQIRDQVLGMAFWNFARKTANLNLVKSAPGTLESPVTNYSAWYGLYPAPPWMYEYQYPLDCISIRYISQQPIAAISGGVPIFSTSNYTYALLAGQSPVRFIIATDLVGDIGYISAITKANPGVITLTDDALFHNSDTVYVTGIIGMTELNNILAQIGLLGADTVALAVSGININTISYTTYVTGGILINQTTTPTQQKVILTNAQVAIGTYTMQVTDLDLWDALSIQALVSALAGFLAIPLSGDKVLAEKLIGRANNHIIQARASDGNEGLTIQESIPDWIRARNGGYWGGLYGADYGNLVTPYPPLFAVS